MDLTPSKIRNFMLAGHSSTGKTSLAEAMLFTAGASDRLGSVADGNTVTDFDAEEVRRKASISAAVASMDYAGCRYNIIDAPGLFDFELGPYEGIAGCEAVVIVNSARSSISVGANKAWKLAEKNNKAKIFFISQMAAENADYAKTCEALKKEFGMAVCPVVVALTDEGKPTVYADLLNRKAFTYAKGKATEVDFPEDEVEEYILEMNEAVAETDEDLMEKFFAEEPFTYEELAKGISAGVAAGTVAPVLCGDSLALEAIDLTLQMLKALVPAPDAMKPVSVQDKAGNTVELKCDPKGPLVAYVFKTVADPFVGKLSYIKVLSGTLSMGTALTNAASGEQERMGKLLMVKGKKQTDINQLVAGDIGAVTKLTSAKTGDTLCSGDVYTVPAIEFPHPSMSMAIFTKNKGDESKVASAIQRILEEDRTVSYFVNGETGQQILSGMGDQHLDVILSKMKSKFGVEIRLENPRVAYRETIRATAEAEGKHKKQTGGAGQFGDVWIRFEPLNNGEEFEFVNAIVGGAVPKEFIPAVEKGLREAMTRGVMTNLYPMFGIRATLFDGKYHPVDSKEVAFKSAARLAYKAACANAKPTLLEPIASVKVYVPDSNTGDIMGEIQSKRRGRVLGMNPVGDGMQLVEAECPEAEMQDFTTYIRSSTQGRGSFSMQFERYEPLPAHLESKVIEEAQKMLEEEE